MAVTKGAKIPQGTNTIKTEIIRTAIVGEAMETANHIKEIIAIRDRRTHRKIFGPTAGIEPALAGPPIAGQFSSTFALINLFTST